MPNRDAIVVSGEFTRKLWRALITNAVELLEDARALYERGSFGRAQSLTVLAREEIGKMAWIAGVSEDSWNGGPGQVHLEPDLVARFTRHHPKLVEAEQRSAEAATFFGTAAESEPAPWPENVDEMVESLGRFYQDVTEGAQGLNRDKQAGLYVDADFVAEQVTTPSDMPDDALAELIAETATMGEAQLVADHSRMKHDAGNVPYDGTQDLQLRLLALQGRFSDPDDD